MNNDKLKRVVTIILLAITSSAYCNSDSVKTLVSTNSLKTAGYLDGQTGSTGVDLNNDGNDDIIEYTYLSTTPPGTCDQSDCLVNMIDAPTLTFQIKMHEGKVIDGSYMCTSLGVSRKSHNGMKDLFCGPKYLLEWDGEEYNTH